MPISYHFVTFTSLSYRESATPTGLPVALMSTSDPSALHWVLQTYNCMCTLSDTVIILLSVLVTLMPFAFSSIQPVRSVKDLDRSSVTTDQNDALCPWFRCNPVRWHTKESIETAQAGR